VRDYSILRETPFADDFTTELALRLISNEQMGQDDVTDYLAITYSATEQIGHRFGPSSVESSDALVRLDRNIGRLLGEIDKSLGKKNVLVYFVSAHGISELPAGYRQDISGSTSRSSFCGAISTPFTARATGSGDSLTTRYILTGRS